MKKIMLSAVVLGLLSVTSVSAAPNTAPDFLAKKGVIQAHYDDVAGYNLNSNITRREMLKVMMNLSGKTVPNVCEGKFRDLPASDWGCKYAEAALKAGYIAANKNFRPNDNISQIEALKMVMQGKGIERNLSDDWREGYVTKAKAEKLLSADIVYDKNAKRSFIFDVATRTYNDAPELGNYTGDTVVTSDDVYTGETMPDDVMKELDAILKEVSESVNEEA